MRPLRLIIMLFAASCVRQHQDGSSGAGRAATAGDEMTMYELDQAEAPWGDYGAILVHGMSGHLGRSGGRIQLERTGPFIPPVTLPGLGDVIVTDKVRRALGREVPGLVFRPVEKARIVRLDWHTWDRTADEPPQYPQTGEPEDYILERQHDAAIAEQLGPLWELVPAVVPSIQVEGGRFNDAVYDGEDFVRADPRAGVNFVSARLMKAMSAVAAGWITFRPAR
ncbi:hypothetical protein [Anaeromyxobacter oryzae]|uniref:Lipoprotein n=1 Tax=Anaeromyxobacter oryzae TaxID=2918170 RepID=A0ABM7WZQ2_9BACT|nr:hypothetical protein [Anaeromyxobacter oryzae]BDG05024.1 hypothetical protein AMOR_40200 [Anaeromyxobacter oryzae]